MKHIYQHISLHWHCTHFWSLKLTLWPESASGLYWQRDRHLSAKLVPTFVDRGCHVVSVTDPYSRILAFLDQKSYNDVVIISTAVLIKHIKVRFRVSWPSTRNRMQTTNFKNILKYISYCQPFIMTGKITIFPSSFKNWWHGNSSEMMETEQDFKLLVTEDETYTSLH
jgi:hypothetical protein